VYALNPSNHVAGRARYYQTRYQTLSELSGDNFSGDRERMIYSTITIHYHLNKKLPEGSF